MTGGRAGYQDVDWYDVPRYYDIVFDADTDTEAAFLDSIRRRYGRTRGTAVLEPACGSGRLLNALARAGYTVTGFDRNQHMLRFAARRLARAGVSARLFPAAMESFTVRGRFDLAHCLVSTFKYLLRERHARDHLLAVARALKPGGVYVLGLHLSDYDTTQRTRERWVGRRRGTTVVCNTQIWPAERARRRERARTRLVVTDGGDTRRFETNWWFRTYDARQVRRLLRQVPSMEHLATYDFTYRLDAPRPLNDEQLDTVLVLRRRSSSLGTTR